MVDAVDFLKFGRDVLGSAASRTPLSGIRRQTRTQDLLSGIQEAAGQPGFNAATNPLVAQLQTVNPAVGQQVSSNFATLSKQRRDAMIDDARRVRLALDTNPQRAVSILERRIDAGMQDPNASMTDTQEILDQINAGDIDGAKQQLDVFLQAFGDKKAPRVTRSDILPDGTTVQVFDTGATRVTSPEGTELKGAARADAVREAVEFGAREQGQRSRERALGSVIAKSSVERGNEAFNQVQDIRKNIRNLDRVVELVDRGAGTGPIERLFPSVRAASIELDNLRNQLGLDIVSGTTFGALSESELAFALDTALPTGLDGPDLKQWAQDKKAAQQKLAKELEKAARFFSLGGTITEYLDLQNQGAPTGGQNLTFNPETGQLE